ncbi:MAG TPA: hypothetical protein VF595_15360 [Tepidisphaeraceae bacterium]
MRRWIKRIALTIAALGAVVVVVAAVVAWRATRVPAWYATAVDQTPPDEQADDAINRRLLPLQNWLARASTGDLAAKPSAEKIYTLELTEPEVNAILAKFLDHLQGQFQTYRTRLLPGEIDLGFTWAEQGRALGVAARVSQPPDGLPVVSLGDVRLGNQALPKSLVVNRPANMLRTAIETQRRRGRTPRIDEQDAAPGHTVEAYYGRLMLKVLAGRGVSPCAFLPVRLSGDEWVATKVVRLDVSPGRLAVTFRLLTPDERAAVLAELDGPLPGS